MKPFPGSPETFNLIFSRNLFDSSMELEKHGTQRSLQFGEILQGLSLCLLAPRSYFDLFMKIAPYYGELNSFWNNEVYAKNGGTIGSGQTLMVDVDAVGVDTSILNEIHPASFNLVMGLVSFTQDEKAIAGIPGVSEEMKEQMMILNQILWAIYMSVFNPSFFDRNVEVFTKIALQAQKEINTDRNDLN